MEKFKRRFYDSHPELPLDPDSDQLKVVRPIHTDPAHVAVVAIGAFFGTLGRYEISLRLPAGPGEWPVATLFINIAGAFLLGLLLEVLLRRGKDDGGRRILRLVFGAGFLGAFTTYSSLALSAVSLAQGGQVTAAILYGGASVVFGAAASALGIQLAVRHRKLGGGRA